MLAGPEWMESVRKLLLLATLLMLPACCGTKPKPGYPSHCRVPVLRPPPELHPYDCPPAVCLPWEETVALALWVAEMNEIRAALKGCTQIDWIPQ